MKKFQKIIDLIESRKADLVHLRGLSGEEIQQDVSREIQNIDEAIAILEKYVTRPKHMTASMYRDTPNRFERI